MPNETELGLGVIKAILLTVGIMIVVSNKIPKLTGIGILYIICLIIFMISPIIKEVFPNA